MALVQCWKKQLWTSSSRIRNGSARLINLDDHTPWYTYMIHHPSHRHASCEYQNQYRHNYNHICNYNCNYSTAALTTTSLKSSSKHKSEDTHTHNHKLTSTTEQSDPNNDEDNQHDTTAQNEDTDEQSKVAKNIKELLHLAWIDYKYTWEGFLDNTRLNKEEHQTQQEDEQSQSQSQPFIDTEALEEKGQKLKANANRNVQMIREEGPSIVGMVKEQTGLKNKRDVKAWAMDQLKLANECVANFMKGYRVGRDEEMDNMMNEYFKDSDFDSDTDDQSSDDEDKDKEDDSSTADVKRNVGRRRRTKTHSST